MSTEEKVFTQEDVNDGKKKIHPNSLANLKPRHDKQHMEMMCKKADEARLKNDLRKEQMKDVLK